MMGADASSSELPAFTFVPHLDFVASGKFSFPQNMQNISPFSKRVPKAPKTVRVSLGAIGESCEYDRELVGSILKDVVFKFIEQNRKGKECCLDLRIGVLRAYPNGELQFESKKDMVGEQDDLDDEVMAINKRRQKPRGAGDANGQNITEANLESLARAMSSGA